MANEVKNEDTLSDAAPPTRAEPTVRTKEEFEAALQNAKGPVLVDFIQPDCGPCIEETPVFNKLAEACKTSGSTIMRVDVTQGFGEQLAMEHDVEGTPTSLFAETAADFKAGKTRELADLDSSAARRKLKCSIK